MKPMSAFSVVVVAVAFPSAMSAAQFDGSQSLICAAVEIYSCEPDIKCEQETAEMIDLPQLLKVSVQDKSVVGLRPSGEPVNAKIELVRHSEQKLFLQGVEKRFGWNIAIDEAKGKMALTIGDDGSGYVVFGACMPE